MLSSDLRKSADQEYMANVHVTSNLFLQDETRSRQNLYHLDRHYFLELKDIKIVVWGSSGC